MSYMTLSSQQKSLFQQNSLTTPIFPSLQAFAPIPQHYFSKYWGDQCMGRPPPQIWGGDRPPSPPPLALQRKRRTIGYSLEQNSCFSFPRILLLGKQQLKLPTKYNSLLGCNCEEPL